MALLDDGYGNDRYRKGGFYRIDDRDGSRQRASDTLKEWNGAIVSKGDFEPRQPQDFVRGRPDRQAVPDPRPPESIANATFVGTPTQATLTATANAGATALIVDSNTGFKAADTVAIMLDSLDRYLAVLASVTGTGGLTLTTPLPGSASAGNLVIDNTALVPPNLG